MKRLLLCGALLAACSNTVATISSGQFASPVGLAATSAGDRDLVFIANSGKDGLIALQLCNEEVIDGGSNLVDGGPDNCGASNENAQFIPGPIRVFPGTIETAPRTVRVAGARLLLPDGGIPAGGPSGEGLAVGADQTVQVVDALALVAAEHGQDGGPPIVDLPDGGRGGLAIPGIGVDIAAANPLDPTTDLEMAAASVKVFVVTQSPAQLLVLTASLDANGAAQLPSLDASCDLGTVVPRKVAVTPGTGETVYVADGAGDGVVSIPAASIAGGPCPITRISAGGRPTRSVAVSPPWYETNAAAPHPAGEIVMMVVEPLATALPGQPLDPGGVLFARTSDGVIFPVPPFDWTATDCAPPGADAGPVPCEAMQPLQPSGLAREAAFLRSLRCVVPPCTPLNFGTSTTNFDLLAAVTSTDGSNTFIDVRNRRFPDPDLVLLVPGDTIALSPTVTPLSPSFAITTPSGTVAVGLSTGADPNGPALTVNPNSLVPGVTHSGSWRTIWHSPVTGLDRRAGILSQSDPGTLSFVTSPADLAVWTQDPAFQLAPGDVVAFTSWSSSDPNCQELVNTQNVAAPAGGTLPYELPILSISGGTLVLGQVAGTVDLSGACASVATVGEVRVAGARPWLVFNGATAVGRAATGVAFTAHEARFDYPYDSCVISLPGVPCYDAASPPVLGDGSSFQFTISADASVSGTGFLWSMASGQAPLGFRDPNLLSGFGTAVLGYSSPRVESLVFTSMTGANEVLQADPAVLAADPTTGIQAYR